MIGPRRRRLALGIAAVFAAGLCGCGPDEPRIKAPPPEFRLLTESQYRAVIADIFGPDISFAGHFDPLRRAGGLLAVGARSAEVTPAGSEEFVRMARQISEQVVGQRNRDILVPCAPKSLSTPDGDCARLFLTRIGRLLYRRPLTPVETDGVVEVAGTAAQTLGDFYDGLGAALAGMLVSPNFLFVADATEPDSNGGIRLTGYAKASRLSFLLWNSAPDEALLQAAEHGELNDGGGVKRQVDRMLASPRLNNGVRAFFSDMLSLDDWDNTEKDAKIYPLFNASVANDAREQTLRTITSFLIRGNGDYRDLFTTRKTFMTGSLARLYQVPVSRPDGGWMPFEFPKDDPRAGIAAEISFAALYSHPERSSPTIRGRAIRQVFLCEQIPDPPGNVNFDLFNDPKSPRKTQRQRLAAHASAPTCAGCHKLTDPVGLAMETLDGAGQLRDTENGEKIDTRGALDGISYDGLAGLSQAIHDNPALPGCLVYRVYSFAAGHLPGAGEHALLQYFKKKFVEGGYRLPALLREIATSEGFFAVAKPGGAPAIGRPGVEAGRGDIQENRS